MASLPKHQWRAMGGAKERERPFGLLTESESQEKTGDNLENHTLLRLLDRLVGKEIEMFLESKESFDIVNNRCLKTYISDVG